MTTEAAILKNLFVFEQDLVNEMSNCKVKKVIKGEILIRQNSYINTIPMVLDGMLRVFKQTAEREVLCCHITKGETCSMSLSASFQKRPANFSVVAFKNSYISLIPSVKMVEWLKYQTWNRYVINTFSKTQLQLSESIDGVVFNKIEKRLKDYLFRFAEENNSPVIPITHQEIANELGTTREVISRILKTMESKGSISLKRAEIIIHN